MASTNKTPNLKLNSWIGSDKPKRTDFVGDNDIIDRELGNHLNDTVVHLTEEDRQKLDVPFSVTTFSGTGVDNRILNFSFEPSFVIVYKRLDSFCKQDSSGNTKINGAFFAKKDGTDSCGVLSKSTLKLRQSSEADGGFLYNLNEQYGQYVVVCFK